MQKIYVTGKEIGLAKNFFLNPQFLPDQPDIQAFLPTHELVISLNFIMIGLGKHCVFLLWA